MRFLAFVILAGAMLSGGCESGAPTAPDAPVSGPAPSAAAPGNTRSSGDSELIALCHRSGSPAYVLIQVDRAAVATHRAHGDAAPGEPIPAEPGRSFDANCSATVMSDLLTGTFIASGFDNGPFVPPTDPVSGSFSLTFDDSVVTGVDVELFVVPLDTLSMTPIGGHTFTTADTLAQLAYIDGQLFSMLIGGAALGPNAMTIGGEPDFMVGFVGPGLPLGTSSASYVVPGIDWQFEAGVVEGSVSAGP